MITSKHIVISAIAATLLFPLAGCGKKIEEAPVKKVEIKTSLKPLSNALIPNGHWLVNPLYCAKQLPSQGVYDFKISDTTFTMIGIDQKGAWYSLDDQALRDNAQSFLETDNATCLDMSLDALTYATFTAPGTKLTLAYSPGADSLIVIKGNEAHLATRFDMDILKHFEFVEIEQPDVIDEEEPQTTKNQLIEVVCQRPTTHS